MCAIPGHNGQGKHIDRSLAQNMCDKRKRSRGTIPGMTIAARVTGTIELNVPHVIPAVFAPTFRHHRIRKLQS